MPWSMLLLQGVKRCKFRHIEGSTMHKSLHIDNLRNISQSMPGEGDGFHVNPKYCAVPISGSAGLIAIIQVNSCCFLSANICDCCVLSGMLFFIYTQLLSNPPIFPLSPQIMPGPPLVSLWKVFKIDGVILSAGHIPFLVPNKQYWNVEGNIAWFSVDNLRSQSTMHTGKTWQSQIFADRLMIDC